MALTFVFGNSGSGKSHYLYEKTVRMAAEDARTNYFVVVPEQFTLQTQKELVSRTPRQVIMNIDVVSFERLACRVFDELGIRNTIMEETGKSLVLRRIAGEKEKELTALKGNIRRMGYIDELKSIISELMQYNISAEDMDGLLAEIPQDVNLYRKLSDIRVMYGAFEDYLRDGYVTAEKVLDVLMDAADRSGMLHDCVMVFDGFTGFTPVQMKLLHRLMHVARDLYVAVTMDARENAMEDRGIQDLFYMSRKMTRSLAAAAREEGYEIGEPVYLKASADSRFGNNPVLAHLEQNLFRPDAKRYDGCCGERLKISSLASPKAELAFAAANIRRLVRDRGMRYSEFAVVSGDVQGYEKYAESVFAMYEIPYFADMKKDILCHPLIELIRGVLEIAQRDYSYESVMRCLRTGLAGFSGEETDLLENYMIAKGIRGISKWEKKFIHPMRRRGRLAEDKEQAQEELAVLNVLRQRFLSQTRPLYDIFRRADATVREQTVCLYEFLRGLRTEEQLAARRQQFEEQGDEVLESEYRQVYRIVIDLLDKMADLLGEECVGVSEYADILEAGFSSAKVGSVPPGGDCVILGDIERTRLDGVKVLFFLGVNDGLIPKGTERGGILSQYDRELLKQRGAKLSPTAREQTFLQRFYLYLNMTKPSQALCLTCSRMTAEGREARPSYLIATVKKLFRGLCTEEIETGAVPDFATPASGMEAYLQGLLLAKRGEILPEWKSLHRWFLERGEFAPVIDDLLRAAFDGFSQEHLGEDIAKLLYGTALTNSVTRLEMFARCAYAHFLEYGLKLAQREQFAFASVDMGSMFHEILQRYCRKLEERSGWYTVTEGERETFLREAFEEAVLLLPNESLAESARGSHILERIYRIMDRSVWAITEQIRRGSFLPGGYEVEFVQASSPDEIGRRMRLVGRIDRMDVYETEEKVYVRVIDYKSGDTTFQLLNFYYGRQLQLTVYLNAVMEKLRREHPDKEVLPAGIFYYCIDDPMVENAEGGEEEIAREIFRQLHLNGLVSLDPEAYLHMDAKISGKSDVLPLSVKKDGTVSSRGTSGAGQEDFARLMEFAGERVRKAASEMLSGDIRVEPFELNGRTGCDYCPYRSVCGFDVKVAGYSYRKEEKLTDEELWERIRKKEA